MEEDPATPSGTAGTPFSEATDTFVGGSAPDLTNHPHLDNSMRSLSSSVAARRKVRTPCDWHGYHTST